MIDDIVHTTVCRISVHTVIRKNSYFGFKTIPVRSPSFSVCLSLHFLCDIRVSTCVKHIQVRYRYPYKEQIH